MQRSAGVMLLEPAGAWLRGRAAEARAIGSAGSEPSFPGPMHVLRSYSTVEEKIRAAVVKMQCTALRYTALPHLDHVRRYALYLAVHRASHLQRPPL